MKPYAETLPEGLLAYPLPLLDSAPSRRAVHAVKGIRSRRRLRRTAHHVEGNMVVPTASLHTRI